MASDVLFEIGVEELPARFITDAENQLRMDTISWLDDLRISYSDVVTYSTPRRLAVHVKGIAHKQTAISEEVKGPQLKIAKDQDGNWTKAAIGFTKGQGMTTDAIYIKEIKNVPYVFVEKYIGGKYTNELLPSFKTIIEGLTFPQTMRWGEETLNYARPIRWLVALYGKEVIPFEIAGVTTGNITYGHRFLSSKVTIGTPDEYSQLLKENYVIASAEERQSSIETGIDALEKNTGFRVLRDNDLLEEVCHLVEYPTVFYGSFQEAFLQLPEEVLTASMISHQRYFPVKDENGNLLAYFVGVRNGDDTSIETVVRGNERVLDARLEDAQFFYEEDLKQTLDVHQEKLEYVVFQDKLGTMKDKTNRMLKLTEQLADVLNCDASLTKHALRAAALSKFDLTTDMVNEFTDLQGVIGEKYAIRYGEEAGVARAIREHYLPIQANGDLPETEQGALVGVSDKLDTIVGCIGAGLIPTGSQDPYGLRRKALGILNILMDRNWDIRLEQLLETTINMYEQEDTADIQMDGLMNEVERFFKLRASYILKELSIEPDIVEAVLDGQIGNFVYVIKKANVISEKRHDKTFKTVHEALVRVLHLADAKNTDDVDTTLFQTASERKLYHAFHSVKSEYKQADEAMDATTALECIASLASPIHTFFEENMVMAEDSYVRRNRLAFIQQLAMFIQQYADLSVIEWKQQF